MEILYVYADFDWLKVPMLVGELGYDSLRGSDSYSFQLDNERLRHYGNIMLSADINNYPGQQYVPKGGDIFGCFSDALPDRWGRTLLHRRVAFNIAMRNTDDHFRNHGFLLSPQGWRLSPAYDMNPTLNDYQSILINSTTNESNLQILLDSSEEYMISRHEAQKIIEEVVQVIKQWKLLAIKLGIAKREIELFEWKITVK